MVKSLGAERYRPKLNEEFQISRETGFLPPAPLQRLPPAYELWERALADANDTLSLGEDDSEEAVSRREASEQWRQRLREVSAMCRARIQMHNSNRRV
jgi:indoleamine 2,3-dioxygenase